MVLTFLCSYVGSYNLVSYRPEIVNWYNIRDEYKPVNNLSLRDKVKVWY